ncbi:MAG TPA: hypothetical protein VGF24_14315 [Vicinamibacterales bacterium]|jgi:hypothetical protein
MGRVRGALTTLTLFLMTGCASAQTISARSFPALAASVTQAADARETRELHIRWTGGQATQGPRSAGTGSFKLVKQARVSGAPRRERQPELSASDLVVVVQDAYGQDVDWRIVPNPRIVRAEVPGPDGLLSGRVIERDDVELLVLIPDVPGADRIQIFSPVWTGKDYRLDPLGQIEIGSGR